MRTFGGLLSATMPRLYIMVILVATASAYAYHLRMAGIFACQASGYGSDRYLAYCQATSYGDYDYGAFWFDLEPAALDAATSAEVLFLGNSRMQFGLSTSATTAWLSSLSRPYYFLGFSYDGNYRFAAPLLRKLMPRAKAYVINLDLFFEDKENPPSQTVLHDAAARSRHVQKRLWQKLHKPLCGRLPMICRDEAAFFRSRPNGTWVVTGGRFTARPVSYVDSVNQSMVSEYAAAGTGFFAQLRVNPDCIILTNIPTVRTGAGTAEAIAAALGHKLVAPRLEGLTTFDGSHLDLKSAERWSAAFAEAAGPQVRKCLGQASDSTVPAQTP